MNRNLLLRAALVLPTIIMNGCADRPQPDASESADDSMGGVAVYCALNTPDALNPLLSADEAAADLRPVLYTPLVLYDSVGGFKPHLARSWSWSADNRELQLNLRNDVRWHDGQSVTGADVVWTIKTAADPAYPYSGRAELTDIEDVTAADSTVHVKFSKSFAAGLEPFTRIPILPKHLLDTVPAAAFAQSSFHREPVGSGPFRFAGRLPDGSLKLDRFADFPEELGRARLDRVVLREVPDPPAILVELRSGGVDVCAVGSSISAEAANAGNQIISVVPVGALIISVDHRKSPFNDVRVRRALSAALNRTEIAAIVSRAATPARTFLPLEAVRWTNATLTQPDNDVALAGALLDSTGWQPGAADGTRRNAAGERLSFTITAPAPLQRVLPVIQSQLRRAGIDVQLRLMEPGSFYDLLGKPDARPAAIAVTFTPDRIAMPDVYELFHSDGGQNIASYERPRVDTILERLQTAIEDNERAVLYHELQRYVADDIPVIYVVHAPRMLAVRPRLRDVRVDANGPFAHIAEWWIPADQRRR
jgi:peptide/nickel transport system substrate-binding protein